MMLTGRPRPVLQYSPGKGLRSAPMAWPALTSESVCSLGFASRPQRDVEDPPVRALSPLLSCALDEGEIPQRRHTFSTDHQGNTKASFVRTRLRAAFGLGRVGEQTASNLSGAVVGG